MLNLLSELRAELGLTFIFIAHDLSVVEHICDRIAVMFEGRFMGEVIPESCTIEEIGLMMAGSIPQEA